MDCAVWDLVFKSLHGSLCLSWKPLGYVAIGKGCTLSCSDQANSAFYPLSDGKMSNSFRLVIVGILQALFVYTYFLLFNKYTGSKKTGQLRIIWHNFTDLQRVLIIFGRERPYSILSWRDKKFLNWFRTSFVIAITTVVTWCNRTANFWTDFEQRVIDKAINEWENNCGPVSRPKDCSSNTCCNFSHRTLFQ